MTYRVLQNAVYLLIAWRLYGICYKARQGILWVDLPPNTHIQGWGQSRSRRRCALYRV